MNLQNDILDYLGSEATEEMLHEYYDGKSLGEILADLNEMFPSDDNNDLAEKIHKYIGRNPAAVALGSIRSERKAKSSAANGKLGGRPRIK